MTTRVAHLRLAASHSIRSAEIEVNGNTIHYRTGGHGPVLLLLHGIGGCTSTWDPVIDDLARDHRVVAMDLLGHGRSRSRAATTRSPATPTRSGTSWQRSACGT